MNRDTRVHRVSFATADDPSGSEPVDTETPEIPEDVSNWIDEQLRCQGGQGPVDAPIPEEFDGPVINREAAGGEGRPASDADVRNKTSGSGKGASSAIPSGLPSDSRDAPQADMGDLFQGQGAGNTNIRPDKRYVWDAETDTWRDPAGERVTPGTFFRGWSVLSLLGIHGCRGIEDHIIAGMALGEPVLLIGAPGGAKTAMTERLAADMHLRFWAYDASKAMFEDIVGFPDPASLGRGEVRYVPTPLSLIGKQFVLVDEVSRAHPALQNKWLEIIRSRRVMGIALPELQMVFGAMNPTGLAGTVPLDEALAGRFTFHIGVPDINGMSNDERRAVIEAEDRNPVDPEGKSSRIRWVVRAARESQADIEAAHGSAITTYVAELSRYLAGKDWKLDGRRQGMIRRGLVAYLATRSLFMEGQLHSHGLARVLRRGLDALLPFDAMGRDLPRVVLDGAHQYALSAMGGNVRALPPSDLLLAADMIARGRAVNDQDQLSMLVTRVLQTMDRARKPEDRVRAGAALLIMALSPEAMRNLPIEARQRVLVALADSLEIEADKVGDFLDESFKMTIEGLEPQMQEPVLRVAYNIKSRHNRFRGANMEFEQIATMMARYLMEGGSAC